LPTRYRDPPMGAARAHSAEPVDEEDGGPRPRAGRAVGKVLVEARRSRRGPDRSQAR